MSVKIFSLNVNGIRDPVKRQTIFLWLKEQNVHICLLQETHCEDLNDIREWSKEWKGVSYWAVGSKMSKGVAILIREKLDIKISNVIKDTQGRYITLNVSVDELNITIINIYAPNIAKERECFFVNLNKMIRNLKTNSDREVIIGGDFNCTMNNQYDRRYADTAVKRIDDKGRKEISDIMIEHDLEDVYRRRYPKV